jgi:protoporphyrinogen oxidase
MTENQQALTIGIIGSGAAGMAAAWDLVRAGHNVTLFEAGAEVGGLAAGFKDEHWNWSLEKFYHHWFETDQEILNLIKELGVSDKVMFPRPKTSYWVDGKIVRSEMTPYSVLFKLPLSFISKIRLAFTGAFLKYLTRDWRTLEKSSADTWMRRTTGEEAYNRMWKPLLIGKFSDRYQEVNMAWLWSRIKTRSLRLGIFEGGFQAFVNTLAAAITKRGAKIQLNTRVEHIGTQDGKPTLTVKGQTHVFDRVISTVSPELMLRITDGLAATEYGKKTASLESIGAVCVIFALKQSLLTDGTYWLNLPATSPDKSKSQFPFLALVEHTNWMDKAHYNGDVLVYCGDYIPVGHEYLTMPEADLAKRFQEQLGRFNPDFKPEWVRKWWVFRAPYAQPIPGLNHSQVYPWDRGTNFAVEIGRRTARMILEDTQQGTRKS